MRLTKRKLIIGKEQSCILDSHKRLVVSKIVKHIAEKDGKDTVTNILKDEFKLEDAEAE